MKKLITMMSLLSFVAMLGLGSALAQSDNEAYATGCLKDKDKGASWKKVKTGLDAGKCSSSEVTLVQKAETDSLQDQILIADGLIDGLILETDSLQDQILIADGLILIADGFIGDNAADISEIKAGLISSMMGGAHRDSDHGPDTFFMPVYDSLRAETVAEAHSKVAVTGWLTKLVVLTEEPTGVNTTQIFQYIINNNAVDLDNIIDNSCTIGGASNTMCESSGCVKLNMGDTLSVRVIAATAGGEVNISPTRWTGRFVETESECPVF